MRPAPDLNISCHKCFREGEDDGETAGSFQDVCGEEEVAVMVTIWVTKQAGVLVGGG